MGGETKDPETFLTMPESATPIDEWFSVSPDSRDHVDYLFPEVVSDQLPAVVDRLTQELIQCRRKLKSYEAAFDIEKVERVRWENLYKELFAKLRIEQSEENEARIPESKRKMMESKEQLEPRSKGLVNIPLMNETQIVQEKKECLNSWGLDNEKSEKTEARILELERKLDESLEVVTFQRDKFETFEKKMMKMKEQLELKSSEAALDIEKCEKTEAIILDLERKLYESLEAVTFLRDKNETFEKKMMEMNQQLVLNSIQAAIDYEKQVHGAKTESRILELERKLDESLEAVTFLRVKNETSEKTMMEMKQQLVLNSIQASLDIGKSEKTESRILELERKLDESLEAVTLLRDKNETSEKKMMEMKEQLELKTSAAAVDIEKVGRVNLYKELFCKLHVEQSEKTEAWILELKRLRDESLESMKNLRDKNETFEQTMMDMKDQLELKSKSLEELFVAPIELKSGVDIWVKKIGELDEMLFINLWKPKIKTGSKHHRKRWKQLFLTKAEALSAHSYCQQKLQDPTWIPFQLIENGSGIHKAKLNKDDEFLQCIKQKWGDHIHNEVVKTVKDLIKYNPVSRLPVLKLWNSKENRNATLKEVIYYIYKQLKILQQAD